MKPITYIERRTKTKKVEHVYGAWAIRLLYGNGLLSKILGPILRPLTAKWKGFSKLFGWWQSLPHTKKKIAPFIEKYGVDPNEFEAPVSEFQSFNDFFIRKLKPEARPIAPQNTTLTAPADGRYLCYQDINQTNEFVVKGEKFDLSALLQDEYLAAQYKQGSMLIARLCPSDYHRFHFPCSNTPSTPRLINGALYSVNPLAIRRNIHIFNQNKRCLTTLDTQDFGKILFLEVGATSVGSIIQTYTPGQKQDKGAEKGYFSFGGSALILLFKPKRVTLAKDLLENTSQGFETRCLFGESIGVVA